MWIMASGSTERSSLPDDQYTEPQPPGSGANRRGVRTGVLDVGNLPAARADDLRESCEVGSSDDRSGLRLTCTITGSTNQRARHSSKANGFSLVAKAARTPPTWSPERRTTPGFDPRRRRRRPVTLPHTAHAAVLRLVLSPPQRLSSQIGLNGSRRPCSVATPHCDRR